MKIRTCDDKGDDIFAHECKFPFTWNGTTYNDCTTDGTDNLQGWCIQNQKRNSNKHNVFSNEDVQWGFCIPEDEETVPRQNQYVTRLTCGENYHHTCGMNYVYGGIDIHWHNRTIDMNVFTPMENEVPHGLASSITINF